tara:strand:- start:288 stop:497 length:210 start_codon:yes stop_codon:yes gene_type:complete
MKEANNIKAILAKYPEAVAEAKRTHDLDIDSDLYTDVYNLYEQEMTYDMVTGDHGDPTGFLLEKLFDDD